MASVLPFVRGVDFSRTQFKDGHFSEKVAEMSNLRWLRLNRSQLSLLPEEIDKFTKLEVLTISHNELKELHSGNLPSIDSLRVVNASHNRLRDSSLPSDLFRVRDLVTLDLSHNGLTKTPDELLHAKNIIVLSLSHNRITSIPGALFVNLSDIQHMDLSNNELQSLPPQLRRLEHLQHLSLANNPLQHWSFKVLDKLTNLTVLNLSNTGRDFTNTPHIDKLVNLTDIDLSHNDLTRIPESVYLLEKLHRVKVSHNCIKELSSLIDTWLHLVTLDLSNNQLTSLHPNICKCIKLRRLFLSDNKLTFEGIPPAVSKLVNLEQFLAARNQLECIPEGLCRCYNLKKLILTSNCLLTLPEGIHFLKLEKLDIQDNPNLVMPPKPTEQVKGSGAEWYNIDFDPEILKGGAVVASATVILSAHHKRKERRLMIMRHKKSTSSAGHDEESAQKVLKGLVDVVEQRDVMLAGAAVEVLPETSQPQSVKPKRWDALLRRPDLDYSEIFAEDTGKLPGITVWQIENFNPVEVEETFYGQFYIGDCYIVLKTDWNDFSDLSWEVYYWIGKDSSLDKRVSVAMHAVHLRNMLGALGRTHREEMGEESEEFEDLFPEGITYIEGGTLSGFYTVEEEDVVFRLYQLCGVKRPYLEPVDTVAGSLDQSHVFLLDAGKDIYIWTGGKSPLMARSKARLIAEKINKDERKNKSTIHQIRDGIEPDEFWDILGGPPENPIPLKGPEREPTPRRPVMYKAGLGAGYLELPQVEFPQGQLVQSLLRTNEVYILDCYSDVFVWIGRKSARLVRAAALRLAHELLDMVPRPFSAIVSRCQEGTESQIFKARFKNWNDVLAVDFTCTPEMLEKRKIELKKNPGVLPEKKAAKVDLSPLFLPHQLPMPNREANELMMKWNMQLLSMRCCVLEEGRKFSILPNSEKGHFYSGECYFFLCRYAVAVDDRVEERDEDDEDLDEEEDEPEQEIQTVVYFWQGRDAGKMGWLHFTLGIQKKLEEAMDGPIDVILVKQQQEDFKFLSHFGGKFIIHQGKRFSDEEDEHPSLYQIRANSSKICRRVVQVPAVPKSLNSAFCHILKVPFKNSGGTGFVYIWISSQATQEEAIHAEQMGRTMFEPTYSNVVIQEGSEPENFFWVALGGKAEYDTNADFMKHSRLFRCSNEKGFFAVSEKCSDFCQGDLSDEDVMLLDNGVQVFVWFGVNSTEIEKKLAVKSAQVYINYLQKQSEKRKLKIAKRGAEPWEFTRCFHGWVAT